MKMKMVALSVVLSSVSAYALADDGLVTVTGQIVAQTCTLTDDSKNVTVELATVGTKPVEAGQVAAARQFQIALSGYRAATSGAENSNVGIYFSSIPKTGTLDISTGTIKNGSTASSKSTV